MMLFVFFIVVCFTDVMAMNDLNVDSQKEISRFLGFKELGRLAGTSKSMRSMADGNHMWGHHCHKVFPWDPLLMCGTVSQKDYVNRQYA